MVFSTGTGVFILVVRTGTRERQMLVLKTPTATRQAVHNSLETAEHSYAVYRPELNENKRFFLFRSRPCTSCV